MTLFRGIPDKVVNGYRRTDILSVAFLRVGLKVHPNNYAAMIREAIRQHPLMPAMVRQVMDEIHNPEVNYAVLADRMRVDPGVTMNILKLANSSAFAGTRQVDSLQQAFVRLGTRRLFQIVLAQNVAGRLAVRLDGYELEPGALLRHSLCVALTAESLAKSLKLGFSDGLDGFRYEVFGEAEHMLGLGPRDVERIASETLDKLAEIEEILTGAKKI